MIFGGECVVSEINWGLLSCFYTGIVDAFLYMRNLNT